MDSETLKTKNISKEAKRLRNMLTKPGSFEKSFEYFKQTTDEMVEATGVVDRSKVIRSCELLLRNIVNVAQAGDATSRAVMRDTYKEILAHGERMTGVDFSALSQGESTQPSVPFMLESLQVALSGELELPLDLDPQVLKDMISVLMHANERILNVPKASRITGEHQASLDYYIGNVIAAKQNLEPQE